MYVMLPGALCGNGCDTQNSARMTNYKIQKLNELNQTQALIWFEYFVLN